MLFGIDNDAFSERNPWADVLGVKFIPLQGFFNFLIFIRPRYLSIRQESRLQADPAFALYEAIWCPQSTVSERVARLESKGGRKLDLLNPEQDQCVPNVEEESTTQREREVPSSS